MLKWRWGGEISQLENSRKNLASRISQAERGLSGLEDSVEDQDKRSVSKSIEKQQVVNVNHHQKAKSPNYQHRWEIKIQC